MKYARSILFLVGIAGLLLLRSTPGEAKVFFRYEGPGFSLELEDQRWDQAPWNTPYLVNRNYALKSRLGRPIQELIRPSLQPNSHNPPGKGIQIRVYGFQADELGLRANVRIRFPNGSQFSYTWSSGGPNWNIDQEISSLSESICAVLSDRDRISSPRSFAQEIQRMSDFVSWLMERSHHRSDLLNQLSLMQNRLDGPAFPNSNLFRAQEDWVNEMYPRYTRAQQDLQATLNAHRESLPALWDEYEWASHHDDGRNPILQVLTPTNDLSRRLLLQIMEWWGNPLQFSPRLFRKIAETFSEKVIIRVELLPLEDGYRMLVHLRFPTTRYFRARQDEESALLRTHWAELLDELDAHPSLILENPVPIHPSIAAITLQRLLEENAGLIEARFWPLVRVLECRLALKR